MKLDEKERRAWLRLARTQNVGPATFANLIARFGTASASLARVPELARRGGFVQCGDRRRSKIVSLQIG